MKRDENGWQMRQVAMACGRGVGCKMEEARSGEEEGCVGLRLSKWERFLGYRRLLDEGKERGG